MSTLTEEQRKRIEENRRKAIERRAALSGAVNKNPNMGYNKEVIEIFKAIPNRLYDMQTKKWNFLIEDHEKLMALLKPLQPNVLIVPLPRFILKIFSQVPETRTIKDYDLSTLDPVMLHSLLPFQKDGVKFGIQNEGRVLIADDMGLGKTIQAIAIANYYSNDWPLLVVTPSSVRYSWEQSFHTWLPSLDKAEISVINSGKDHIPNNKVILMIISLKNPKSARTKAAQEVIKNVKRIIMLSGTPALSRPIELYTQLSALRPREFFSYMEYGMRYCNGKQTPWGWDFNGSSNMGELQILLEETVMIRRLKSDVLQQLPSKFRQMILLDPSRISTKSKVLMAMSRKLQQESLKGMERRGVLLEYFHETGEVKLKAVCEYILDLLESDKKFICFAHHQNVINGICKVIEEKRIDYIRIDGSVSSEQRLKLCEKFQLNDSCKVAVLSITSANCGITLTAANLVVFAELFWNPGILTQAEDRAHRIGQQDNVVVQYLVAKGTADDEIWPLVQRKLDVLNKAGLSKDNFKSADTVLREQIDQPKLEDFWNELDKSLEGEWKLNCDIPEKRMKLVP
ncbi:SWI/SNF-related matrix-associated like protein [Argiope bruennichi]|uniref:SWI/SNF-related matrix-associated like protein n=1 Tax=Argiope bruennichi TaxID=94029 RepID=A0A8T0G286_ARGBR|nr:SWI/SNF-related matrix-associated like protein [Argiope bruennichi]